MRTLQLLRAAAVLTLAAAHPSAADPAANVVSTCEIRWENPFVVLVAEAHAFDGQLAAETTVWCTATGSPNETVAASATALGPAVAGTSVGVLSPAAFTVCSAATATWLDLDPGELTITERTEIEDEHCHIEYGHL